MTLTCLDRMAARGASVYWVARGALLFLFVEADNATLLKRTLERGLPAARVERGTVLPQERFAHTYNVTLGPTPPADAAHRLATTLARDSEGACVRLYWKGSGRETAPVCSCTIYADADAKTVEAALAETWPGSSLQRWYALKAGGVRIAPSSFSLPDSRQVSTLASRNYVVGAPQGDYRHGLPCLLADPGGQPIHAPLPGTVVWIAPLPQALDLTQHVCGHWLATANHRVLVLDRLGLDWLVDASDFHISWREPRSGASVNPIANVHDLAADAYVDRVIMWLSRYLGVNEVLVGPPTLRVLRLMLKFWTLAQDASGGQVQTLNPLVLAMILEQPGLTSELVAEYGLLDAMSADERTIWRTTSTAAVSANLMPAAQLLRGLLDQPQIGVLWQPPYDLPAGRTLSVSVPNRSRAASVFLASAWFRLAQAVASDTLVVALGTQLGQQVAAEAPDASLLAWGTTLEDALGVETPPADAMLVAGRSADVQALAPLVRTQPSHLLAQADDQVTVRMPDGGTGTALLALTPDVWRRHRQQASAERVPLAALDLPLALVGPDEKARALLERVIAWYCEEGWPFLLVAGRQDAPAVPDAMELDPSMMPTLNPLQPRVLARWRWWAEPLGVSRQVLQAAWDAGADTVPALLHVAQEIDDRATVEALTPLVQSGMWGHAELPLAAVLREERVVLHATQPALLRFFLAAAIDAGARACVWHAPVDLAASALHRLSAIVAPVDDERLPTIAQLVLGPAASLPPAVGRVAQSLNGSGEALILRQGREARHVLVV
jgi:hypothetical protein